MAASAGTDAGKFTWALRASHLTKPLSIRVPSQAPEGATAGVVEGATLTEFSAGLGLGQAWDVGASFGAHLHQWGPGGQALAGDNESVPSFGARDPRLAVGWTHATEHLSLRPHLQVHIPLGNTEAFAGERLARLKAGAALSLTGRYLTWGSELSFLYRPPVEMSSSTWASQVRIASGLMVHPHKRLSAGAEVHLSPILAKQESRSGEEGGAMIPSEALLSIRALGDGWSLGASGGTGLPLSSSSSVHSATKLVRGPTSPLFRGLLELRVELSGDDL
jgi:hypothetical protein